MAICSTDKPVSRNQISITPSSVIALAQCRTSGVPETSGVSFQVQAVKRVAHGWQRFRLHVGSGE